MISAQVISNTCWFPYYLGDLTEKLQTEERLQLIKVSIAQLLTFIRSCERSEFLSEEEAQVLTREGEATPEMRRAEQVARFRNQRAAESKLQEIKERKERRHRSMHATAKTTSVEQGEENLPDEDDEDEREISLALCKALDLAEMLKREEEMLVAFQTANEEGMELSSKEMLDQRHFRADDWHNQGADCKTCHSHQLRNICAGRDRRPGCH